MAMLILTVGLLGLLQSVQVAYEHTARNRIREAAVLLADQEMNHFRRHPKLSSISTARSVVGGVPRQFTVIRESQRLGDSDRLRVAVHWGFKHMTTEHEIYTLKTRRQTDGED